MSNFQFVENPVKSGQIRGKDKHGSGHYHAPRGKRKHYGVDIITTTGQAIVSPIDGTATRKSTPYAGDKRYSGIQIDGKGQYKNYQVKIFYMTPTQSSIGKAVNAGDNIGIAQDLTIKYPGITNHIHFQIKINGKYVDPSKLIASDQSAASALYSGNDWTVCSLGP